jgi:hypothetical protein
VLRHTLRVAAAFTRKNTMKLLALTFALGVALPAHAGGPVIIEDTYEAEPAARLSPGQQIALVAGLIVVGALIFGGGDSDACPCNTPDDGGQCVC